MNTNIRDTQYSNPTPGPPFHISNINSINLNNARNTPYIPPQVSASAGLGSSTDQDFTPAGFTFHDENEMDLSGSGDRSQQDQPSPATISSQSRGGSTSQSSYSPGNTEHNLPYRASPNPKPLPLQPTSSFPPFRSMNMESSNLGNTSNMNVGGLNMFSTTFSTTGMPSDETFNQGFLMGNDWDYTQSTGMTPMSDGSWNQMLESVTMGWDTGMPPQGHGSEEQ